MNVVLTERASDDLSRIAAFIGQDNQQRAEKFVDELLDVCYDLSNMPSALPVEPRYERYGIRRRSHRDYLIFYRSDGIRIDVIHITFGARDYIALLLPE